MYTVEFYQPNKPDLITESFLVAMTAAIEHINSRPVSISEQLDEYSFVQTTGTFAFNKIYCRIIKPKS